MLLPRRQITRRKLCFYYTCKFGVISIKYVINYDNHCVANLKRDMFYNKALENDETGEIILNKFKNQ